MYSLNNFSFFCNFIFKCNYTYIFFFSDEDMYILKHQGKLGLPLHLAIEFEKYCISKTITNLQKYRVTLQK